MVSLALSKQFLRDSSHFSLRKSTECSIRCLSATLAPKPESSENTQSGAGNQERKTIIPEGCRFKYPELLPAPKMEWRNAVREKLERKDMLARRAHIDIPEFYVGSIVAVYSNNKHAADKKQKFVGICIQKEDQGLRHWFSLRNVVDHMGIEIRFHAYDPTLEKIEVLRLEKSMDEHLRYLRDAPPEHSTFPMDMEPEFVAEDQPVPVNEKKVKLRPKPWTSRWQKKGLKGADLTGLLAQKYFDEAEKLSRPWEKYDLMKQYRNTIPEEEQKEIYAEVYSELHQQDLSRKKLKRKQDPKKKK